MTSAALIARQSSTTPDVPDVPKGNGNGNGAGASGGGAGSGSQPPPTGSGGGSSQAPQAPPPSPSPSQPPPQPSPSRSSAPSSSPSQPQTPPTSTPDATPPETSSTVAQSVAASTPPTSSTRSSPNETATPATTLAAGGGHFTTSYNRPATMTGADSAGSTVTAGDPPSDHTSAVSAGSIAGGVIGGLAGLAILTFIISFILRRMNRRNRRQRLALRHESDFGTFNRSDKRHTAMSMGMTEKGHNVAPSISNNVAAYGTASTPLGPSAPEAIPPSQALAASTAAPADNSQLHERPKYVFGQSVPNSNTPEAGTPDSDDATRGAYSEQPQSQVAYNPEAYGNYAAASAYDPNNIGVAVSSAGYQEAQREYQAQGGYDAGAAGQAYYDQQAYYAYGQQEYAYSQGQYYGYSGQQQQQARPSASDAYGGM